MRIEYLKLLFVKDWKELIKSKQALIPMIVVPVIFVVILPLIILLTASTGTLDAVMAGDMEMFLSNLPSEMIPQSYTEVQQLLYGILVYFFAPLFLIIPVMFASIIASSSFAGEKERRTIEGLLYTPLTDRELIFGKTLVSLVPAIGISLLCFVVYAFLINGVGYRYFHHIFFPTASWILMVVWLVPLLSFLSLALVVWISQRSTGMWEAQQISVVLILPIIALVISQAAGVLYLNTIGVFLAGLVCLGVDYLLFRWLVRQFNRERIVTRLN